MLFTVPQLSDITFATGSNLVVYSTPQHPSLTLGPVDTTKSLNHVRMTCLDCEWTPVLQCAAVRPHCIHHIVCLCVCVSVCLCVCVYLLPAILVQARSLNY